MLEKQHELEEEYVSSAFRDLSLLSHSVVSD